MTVLEMTQLTKLSLPKHITFTFTSVEQNEMALPKVLSN